MKKILLLLVASLFVASSAFAILDNAPNNLGLYFDTNADIVCTQAGIYQPFDAYFILTNPTMASVKAFEVGVMQSGASMLSLGFTPVVPGTTLGNPGDGGNTFNFLTGLSAPVVTTPATLLATWNILISAPGEVVFSLGAAFPSSDSSPLPRPMVQDGDTLVLVPVATSNQPGLPAALINSADCRVVANEDASFGAVKALFR